MKKKKKTRNKIPPGVYLDLTDKSRCQYFDPKIATSQKIA